MSIIDDILGDLLATLVKRERVDLIVCTERKATAILRALIEAGLFSWDWMNVVSTTVMNQYDWASFKGTRILLFDELVHHGRQLSRYRKALEELCRLVPHPTDVITAAYAVWEGCYAEDRPDFYYYGSVDSETYERVRDDLVLMLQRRGSLLLDTEHIELTVNLRCGVREFYDALARAGESGHSCSFLSGAGRTNLTIDHPDILLEPQMERCLTPGSNLERTVCKVRVLEKSHDRFSILPILYPNTRCVVSDTWLAGLPAFVDVDHLSNAPKDERLFKELFYLVGLLGSAELLRSVVAALRDLLQAKKVRLEVPSESFWHLKAMFPRLDVMAVREYVKELVEVSERAQPKHGQLSARANYLPEERLLRLTGRLLSRLVMEAQDSAEGKPWGQLMRLAEEENMAVGIDAQALSVVADRLIDSGLMVTNAKVMMSSRGEPYVVRTFAPEGEVIAAKVRQQLMVRTPECLLAT